MSDFNPWNIQSIYQFQFFNCPTCLFKDNSKQEFINHALKLHPESEANLSKICDGSLQDINWPFDKVTDTLDTCHETETDLNHPDEQTSSEITLKSEAEEYLEEIGNQHYFENQSDLTFKEENIAELKDTTEKESGNKLIASEPEIVTTKVQGKCHDCLMPLRSFLSMEDHKLHCKTLQDKICEVCKQQFKDIAKLKSHRLKEHKVKTFNCDKCSKIFQLRCLLSDHKKNVHSNEEFECDICFMKFRIRNSMKEHKRKKHQSCQTCMKRFDSNDELIKHSKHCDAVFKWHICGFVSSSKTALRTHIRNVHEDTQCKDCGEKFEDKFKLTKHINEKHGGLDREHQCDTCGYAFQTTKKVLMKLPWEYTMGIPWVKKFWSFCTLGRHGRRKKFPAAKFFGLYPGNLSPR